MTKTMGYHDHNQCSAMTPMMVLSQQDGNVKFIPYDDLPGKDDEVPEVMLINPIYTREDDYWSGIKRCISEHPKTRFVMVVPSSADEEYARKVLAGHLNMEIVGCGRTKRLSDILDGKVDFAEEMSSR